MSTSTYIYIFGENDTKIWGLTGRERLRRMLSTNHDIKLVNAVDTIPEAAPVLFLNANFLFDARVITAMLGLEKKVVLNSNDGCPAAIRSDGNQAVPLLRNLNNNADHHHKFASLTLSRIHLSDLNIDVQKNLKKKDPPYIFPISDANRSVLENELF
ncbi:MAG TPA: CDP-alcohol phosphatidyltransferase family protein, partial [Nitrosomonas sp.]|nr:CDP-alcohol phosphatidyltransferase family protein [Nitrosomonas sp.]